MELKERSGDMIIELSVATASAAFATLTVYLIRILQKGMTSLDETNRTLTEVRSAVHDLTNEAQQFIHTANQISRDVKGKIKTVEPLFESAQEVGEALHSVTNTVKQAATVLGNELSAKTTVPVNPKVQVKVR
ncbi:DUF948 domain-containing protein [Paenibacillus agricola]|uniref:DUF948 domain-containing protein n=1 Tax=Paenibacillus agricola TaxID=2716264 RepID=A0ABX0IWK8_9BACL|nr:DUF948 domain-containing protein [Paenibacillus agricola]NHN28280.1 DUF948 domain-containing protein [Paenibacillus agricola]